MSTLEEFMDSDDDGFFYIGHSSALIRLSGRLILFDPCWGNYKPYGHHWRFVPEQINCDSILDKIDACIISHIHQDHLCEPILKRINCPILVGEGRPDLEARLRSIVGSYVWPFKYHTWTPCFGDEVQIYFVPHAFNSVDSSCFLRNDEFSVYLGSDNFLDEATCLRVQNDVGETNVAAVPYAFIHSYPFLLQNLTTEEREAEIYRLNYQSVNQAYLFIETFKPKVVVPFGANLFYDDGSDHILNAYATSPFKLSPFPATTGSYFTSTKERLIGPLSQATWRESLDDELTRKQDPVNYDHWISIVDVDKINERLKKAIPLPLKHEIVINDSLTIDAHICEGRLTRTLPRGPYHRYKIDGPILRDWIDGKLTFEQVVGTRRFIYWRHPNEYVQEIFEWIMQTL